MVSYLYPLYICVCVIFMTWQTHFFLFIVAPFELCWKWIYKETHLFEVLSFSTSLLLFWIFRSFCGFLRIRFASLVSFNLFEMIAKSTNNFIFYTIIVAFHVPQFLFRYNPLLIVTTMMEIIIRFSAIIYTNSHTNMHVHTSLRWNDNCVCIAKKILLECSFVLKVWSTLNDYYQYGIPIRLSWRRIKYMWLWHIIWVIDRLHIDAMSITHTV